MRNLSFRYPGTDKQVLDDISFIAEPGQMIALVGRSGSGKSTLANLVPRFYQHNDGKILLDGVEVEDYRLRNLRRHIALVTQQVTLFNDSVANNIAYGDLAGAPREEIERAAKAANAKEFIDNLPQGFDTEVGENGVLLSGGQRQRLAIARALLGRAPADPRRGDLGAGHRVGAAYPGGAGRSDEGAHHPGDRPPPVDHREADLILVMDQGQIVERGSHADAGAERPLCAAARDGTG